MELRKEKIDSARALFVGLLGRVKTAIEKGGREPLIDAYLQARIAVARAVESPIFSYGHCAEKLHETDRVLRGQERELYQLESGSPDPAPAKADDSHVVVHVLDECITSVFETVKEIRRADANR